MGLAYRASFIDKARVKRRGRQIRSNLILETFLTCYALLTILFPCMMQTPLLPRKKIRRLVWLVSPLMNRNGTGGMIGARIIVVMAIGRLAIIVRAGVVC